MTADPSESVFILPDPLVQWPWKRILNPHYLQAKAESSAWIRSFNGILPRVQRAMDLGKIELLAALTYPLENKDVLRTCCDLMLLYTCYDEYTDVAMPHEARQLATIVMDALRNPHKPRPADECVIGEISRQFSQSSLKCVSESARRRFIEALDEYTTAVVEEAHDRAQCFIRNIDDYIILRRSTAALNATFMPIQFTLDLPDEVFDHPVIRRLTDVCSDLTILMNDMYSYNIEQARGDIHNAVIVVMHQENIGLNEAMKWVGDYCLKLVHKFLEDLCHVPSFGKEFDDQVKHYLNGMAYWMRGHDSWSFESQRYFKEGGLDIQKSRRVVLLPRESSN
ncbi:Germacradienol/germacrene D synthase [Termitomyces sp. T112]|nr:Germacradienol/germacrene D synthase [Termitomyces sp. T112]